MSIVRARYCRSAGLGVCLALICGTPVSPAIADGPICVKCFGPEQTYNCAAMADRPISQGELQMFCVSRLALDYAHRGCGVEREAPECVGKTIIYAYESETAAPASALAKDRLASAEREPATLGEFAEEAVASSKSSMSKMGKSIGDAARNAGEATVNNVQKAGNAIGQVTRRTLKCLGSALNDC